MQELLNRALQGVDPSSPGAFWQIFGNLMGLVPWWTLLWLNLTFVAVGLLIAWHRNSSYGKAILWALVLGPFGWLVSWYAVAPPRRCPRCQGEVPARENRCSKCGCRVPK